ncbi:MAG TPA: undecaprenyl-diphosphate phosphatase [Nitrospiraceae bacterium]|jgi:undecaprenyl-diphosphatase|nr:undecaprenyl-diphosphate phosphatase [Nitrospiraceae bacterium]
MTSFGPGLAALLGVLEGLTEFLPVSSTGHLIILGHLLGFTGAMAVSIEIAIQLGSILAIVAYERNKLRTILSRAWEEKTAFRALVRRRHSSSDRSMHEGWGYIFYRSGDSHPSLWFLIGLSLAFIPAAALGLLTHNLIEKYLFNPVTVAAALIVGGLIIIVVETLPRRTTILGLKQVGFTTALWVGLAQCAALVPGISRSGATIVGGLLTGMDRKVATEYSFFLALPTMLAATVYKMIKSRDLFSSHDLFALAVGLVVSFLVAWAVIATFLTFVKNHTLRVFGYYRILLGIVVLLLFR